MRYEKQVTLKNGQPCLLRSGMPEDAQSVIDQFVCTHGETDFLLTYPDEASFTPEQETRFSSRTSWKARASWSSVPSWMGKLLPQPGLRPRAALKKSVIAPNLASAFSRPAGAWALGAR